MKTVQNPTPSHAEASARGRAYGVAAELAGSIIGMSLIGWLIDRWQGTSPIWTLILTGLGAVGGFYNFIRKANALNKEQADALKAARARKSPNEMRGRTASPDLFAREIGNDPDVDTPEFDLPPDLESALEKHVRRMEKGPDGDAKH